MTEGELRKLYEYVPKSWDEMCLRAALIFCYDGYKYFPTVKSIEDALLRANGPGFDTKFEVVKINKKDKTIKIKRI
jgi:hypothetical protein